MYSEGAITRKKAAETLGMSERQVTRMRKEYERLGDGYVIHKNTGRTPPNALLGELKEKVLTIHDMAEHEGVNHTHFQEILLEDYGIDIPYTSLHRVLTVAGKQSPKKKKQPVRRMKRKRKEHPGELVQIDATPFEWLGGETKYAMHGAIDDATGEIVGLYMTGSECLFGYLEVMRQCIEDFGVPQSLYSDMHTIFRSPKTDRLSVQELIDGKSVSLTQFGRAMHELGVDIINAKSPQAKGRIEKMWDTLQGRLPVEFRKRGLSSLDAANRFLAEYRFQFNNRFSVTAEAEPMYVPFPKTASPDHFLCIKHERRVDSTCVFSFKNRSFKIDTKGYPLVPGGSKIMVYISPRLGIKAEYGGNVFDTIRYIKPDTKQNTPSKTKHSRVSSEKIVGPHLSHSSQEWKKIWWDEDYQASLQFLDELFFSDAHRHTARYG
jgi:transposase